MWHKVSNSIVLFAEDICAARVNGLQAIAEFLQGGGKRSVDPHVECPGDFCCFLDQRPNDY